MRKKPKKHIAHRISIGLLGAAFLLFFITAVYFIALISIEYKSIPFINSEIEKRINSNLSQGNSVKIGQTFLKLSQLYKIKVRLDDIRLNSENKKEVVLPKIELEFSINNLILFKPIPSSVKIINPQIDIDDTNQSPKIVVNGLTDQEKLLQQSSFSSLSQIFVSLKDGQVPIKNFSIIDAKINFKNKSGTQLVTLKDGHISTFFDDGYLHLVLQSKISFDALLPNLEINANCQFKKNEGLKCNTNFKNLIPAAIAFFDPQLAPLSKITGDLSGDINFAIDRKNELSYAVFDVHSESGSFNYPQYFSDNIGFKNLVASGKLDNVMKTFSLDNLKCNFGDAAFAMSLSASNFLEDDQKTVMQFKVNNLKIDALEILWPLFLNENNVRSWVIKHIRGGEIKDGYATLFLDKKKGVEHLQKIESELAFSGANLNYDDAFPPISKIDGIASFTKKQMKIDISKGEVLQSKINFANITIPNFDDKKIMLEINGKVFGAAEDSLKHISYKSEFANVIGKYFSGKAETELAIKMPIEKNLQLRDVYIKVLSKIENFSNEYIGDNSNISISTIKQFANNNFNTEIDLTKASIHLQEFGISKKNGVPSKIKTVLSFDGSNIFYLKNFDWQQEDKSLSGNLSLKTEPLQVAEINLKNRNFANSNFDLNYKISSNSRFIKLTGKSLDLRPMLADNSDDNFSGFGHHQKNDIQIFLKEIHLANRQKLKDVNIDLDCDGAKCRTGFVKAKLNSKQNVDIEIYKSTGGKNSSQIEGSIEDISVLAKAFNLSNQIIGGSAKINAEIGVDQIKGELKIDSGFTILKNEVVEKIYSNNIFSNLRDKFLNSNQIKFDNLKLEFELQNDVININTLIAGSSLMGITAKGKINLNNDLIALKGLIIPGYALNKIFGIGQVPIIGRIIVGEEGGGIFAVRYNYLKNGHNKKGDFTINPASAVIPGGIRNIFDLF